MSVVVELDVHVKSKFGIIPQISKSVWELGGMHKNVGYQARIDDCTRYVLLKEKDLIGWRNCRKSGNK